MILWTPMQLELVFDGLEGMNAPKYEHLIIQGVPMLVERTADGRKKIVKLLSTDPNHYLKENYFPGNYVKI